MPRAWFVGGLLLACLAAIGCQGSTPSAPQTGSTEQDAGEAENSASEKASKGALPKVPILADVDSWEGNWVISPSIQRQNANFGLIRLYQGDEGKWQSEVLPSNPAAGKIDVTSLKIDGQQIRVEGTVQIVQEKTLRPAGNWNFEGMMDGGAVRGSMFLNMANGLFPTRLLPTDADTLDGYVSSELGEGAGDFEKALRDPDPARGLWKMAKTYRNSPLALDAYGSIFIQLAQGRWTLTPEEIEQIAADNESSAKIWGPRLLSLSMINVGARLSEARKSLDVAEKQLDAGEKILPERSESLDAMLQASRMNIRAARGLAALNSESAETAAAAYADLQEVLKERQNHVQYPELLFALAEHAQEMKENDAAINFYLPLASLPQLEQYAIASRAGMPAGRLTPRQALEQLWQEKHGSLDALKPALAEFYDQRVAQIFEEVRKSAGPSTEAAAGNRTVLIELFTNTACGPCVAADLAVEALAHDLPPTEAILLEYHVHDPAPDPLTCLDGEERASFYKVEGRPTLLVDGRPIPNVGGPFFAAMLEQAYRTLRMVTDFRLKSSTDITIHPQADIKDGTLTVNVTVDGLTEEELSQLRLRVAVVEENVEYVAPNGIRHHPMVVRTLLGGPSGIAAKQGVLKYSLQMPLVELKTRQLGYLSSYEHGRRMEFPQKPLELKPLRLVAFVQNDATREVVQAASAPVTGEFDYPEIQLPTRINPGGQNSPPESDADPKSAADGAANSTTPEK